MGIAGNKLAPEMIDRSEFIDQPALTPGGETPGGEQPASPRVTRKRAADLAMTPEGMASGSLQSEQAKVQRLLEHAQELEAIVEAPYDPTAGGQLVPDVVMRPDKEGGGGRKRLTALHGSVTMQGVGEEAEQREREAKEQVAAAKEKKLQAAEKKEAAAAAASARDAAFALCEVACVCGVTPCPYAKWKRCPVCGPKNGTCKVRGCVAARRPLLLGYTPAQGLLEGVREALEGVDGAP